MRRHVFESLQMRHTTEERANERTPHQSSFYDNVTPYSLDGQVHSSPYNDYSSRWASGGFLSTSEDLVRFGSAHIVPINDGFLKPETLELMFTPRTRQAGILGYGLGWMTMHDLHLRRFNFHFGAGSGATSVLLSYPDQRASIAILANLGHARFPFNRIMGVTNAFVGDPARPIFSAFAACFFGAWIIAGLRRLRERRVLL